MPSTSLTLLSVVYFFFLFFIIITFVSAIPAPDNYIHFKPPAAQTLAQAHAFISGCADIIANADLFSEQHFKSRDAPPGPEKLDFNLTDASSPPSLPSFLTTTTTTTRELDVLSKRTMGVKCGVLSSNPHRDVSSLFTDFVAGALYDLIIDYPYNGATGGKSRLVPFSCPTFPPKPFQSPALKNSRTVTVLLPVIPPPLTNHSPSTHRKDRHLLRDRHCRRSSHSTRGLGLHGLWRGPFEISSPS